MQGRNRRLWAFAGIVLALGLPTVVPAQTASPERVEEISKRGAEVMPFDLKQTQHVFTKTETGGVQQVVVRAPANAGQIKLIRQHLTKISEEFARGDFSDPARIHGENMPGLAELKNAQPGTLHVEYRELPNGAEIVYSSGDPALIAAVHRRFDAQLAEHGPDAMPGHPHGTMHPMHPMHDN
ncbi:aspartate carbamoyltransferase [Methylocaldum gracile]|nr:aspartate carbamoyltransferase [Methylocaldum sp. BRCS4]